jgi:hypothetical protein
MKLQMCWTSDIIVVSFPIFDMAFLINPIAGVCKVERQAQYECPFICLLTYSALSSIMSINRVPTIFQKLERRYVDARIKPGIQRIVLPFQKMFLRRYLRCGERCIATYCKVVQKKRVTEESI